jgi:DNA-binding transcriptional ArsR family regulator
MVIPMAKIMQDSLCESSCAGTEADVAAVKARLVDDGTASDLADLFKALGDPTRVRIIHALLQSKLCVHDLTIVLGMGQSAVSHQLRILRNMRIVKRRKEGKTVYYSLDDEHVAQIFRLTLDHVRHSKA